MSATDLRLPRDLGDGLVLRWATWDDVDQLALFNSIVHGRGPDEPALEVAAWTRDLLSGRHPTVTPADFTVVVDTNEQVDGRDKIVSTIVLLSQRWAYDGIEFGVGQPEIVGTDPAYRRRGLIRTQMDVIHALSASRGEVLQGITGIPWYYRQFGYEMTVDLSGSRAFFWDRSGNLTTKPDDSLRTRPLVEADLPFMQSLYGRATGNSFLTLVRDDVFLRYRVFGLSPDSAHHREYLVVETEDGEAIGYFNYSTWGKRYHIDEIAAAAGRSLRQVALSAVHHLRATSEVLPADDKRRGDSIVFRQGAVHPTYTALGDQLERLDPPYAWYIRVPDIAAFLRIIAPALERNLANSVMAGHTGALKLNLYTDYLELRFERGRLVAVEPYTPTSFWNGDAYFPDLTFLHVLFRYRTLEELNALHKDCYPDHPEAEILINAIFPKQPVFLLGYS